MQIVISFIICGVGILTSLTLFRFELINNIKYTSQLKYNTFGTVFQGQCEHREAPNKQTSEGGHIVSQEAPLKDNFLQHMHLGPAKPAAVLQTHEVIEPVACGRHEHPVSLKKLSELMVSHGLH
ncbi:Hypothetical_protein [Hexamita inflata]|uniref:Hypothetical_protein n=1 Tax=Hexamita inflata TaxID=28002 RepID=A0AA86TXB2_9EUKA|nr:Hypothetical protein HINF_LOCUS20580 [Hexamita inflata]